MKARDLQEVDKQRSSDYVLPSRVHHGLSSASLHSGRGVRLKTVLLRALAVDKVIMTVVQANLSYIAGLDWHLEDA